MEYEAKGEKFIIKILQTDKEFEDAFNLKCRIFYE